MTRTFRMFLLAMALCAVGCIANPWRTSNFADERLYPTTAPDDAAVDENRILAFLPTIGFKRDTPPNGGQPVTEAVFIRSDNDHFHQTVTVKMLGRIDQPGFVTSVHVDSYAIGQEGADEAGQATLDEIDRSFRNPRPVPVRRTSVLSIGEDWDAAKDAAAVAGFGLNDAAGLEILPPPDGFYLNLPDHAGLLVLRNARTDKVASIVWIENFDGPKAFRIGHPVDSYDPGDRDATDSHGLSSQIDKPVSLEGQFGGPGKEADFVMVNGTEIYLTGKPDSAGERVPYGSIVKMHGTLRLYRSPVTTQPAGALSPQAAPDFLFIKDATVHVVGGGIDGDRK
jgi:hypothetical protein